MMMAGNAVIECPVGKSDHGDAALHIMYRATNQPLLPGKAEIDCREEKGGQREAPGHEAIQGKAPQQRWVFTELHECWLRTPPVVRDRTWRSVINIRWRLQTGTMAGVPGGRGRRSLQVIEHIAQRRRINPVIDIEVAR